MFFFVFQIIFHIDAMYLPKIDQKTKYLEMNRGYRQYEINDDDCKRMSIKLYSIMVYYFEGTLIYFEK